MSCFLTAWAIKASQRRRCAMRLPAILARLIVGDPNSSPWARRSVAAPAGCCCRDRRAIASSSTNGPPTIATPWPAARRSWRWICTSIPITWTSAPRPPVTSIPSWRRSVGKTPTAVSASSPTAAHSHRRKPYAYLHPACSNIPCHRRGAGHWMGTGHLQGMQRSTATVHVELCRTDLQDRIRPLHEKLQKMIEADL